MPSGSKTTTYLSITSELLRRGGLNDQRIAVWPIIAAAREQSHALAFTLDDQAIAIMFHFVKEIRAGRNCGAARR
jgi:hypothetical protein